MLICPKCRNEYRDGFTHCAECRCELVTPEELERLELEKSEPEEMRQQELCMEPEAGQEPDIQPEQTMEMEQDPEAAPVRPKDGYKSGLYRNSAQKAEDNRTSAWPLLTVGVLGLVFLALAMLDVIPLRFGGITRFMVYGVMFALFVLFLVMGIVSLRNSKIFARKAESENTLFDSMKSWCLSNLTPEGIDEDLFQKENELTEEMKYFERHAKLKRILSDKYMNLDEGFLEDFVDRIYEEIYKEQ